MRPTSGNKTTIMIMQIVAVVAAKAKGEKGPVEKAATGNDRVHKTTNANKKLSYFYQPCRPDQ